MTNKSTNKLTIKKAFLSTIPVLTGYMVLGIAFGILLSTKGYSFYLAPLMSLVIFAGSMQFVAINLISSGLAGALGAITNTALVMGMLYVVYASKIVAMVGASFKVFLISVISSSAVIEAISTFILVSAVTTIYYKTKRG